MSTIYIPSISIPCLFSHCSSISLHLFSLYINPLCLHHSLSQSQSSISISFSPNSLFLYLSFSTSLYFPRSHSGFFPTYIPFHNIDSSPSYLIPRYPSRLYIPSIHLVSSWPFSYITSVSMPIVPHSSSLLTPSPRSLSRSLHSCSHLLSHSCYSPLPPISIITLVYGPSYLLQNHLPSISFPLLPPRTSTSLYHTD